MNMAEKHGTDKNCRTGEKAAEAAIKLVAKHGFAETTFKILADKLGISEAEVLRFFPNKNALMQKMVQVIIRHNHAVVDGLIRSGDDAGYRLLRHCVGNVAWAVRNRGAETQILILLYYLAGRRNEFADTFDRMTAGGRQRILKHLLAGKREGMFHFTSDPAAIAELLHHSLFGAMLYAAAAPKGSVKESELEKAWMKVIIALTNYDGQPTQSFGS